VGEWVCCSGKYSQRLIEEQGEEAIRVDGSLMGGIGGGDIHPGSTVTVRVQDSFHIFIQDGL